MSVQARASRMCACLWLLLATCIARVPLVRATEEDTSSRRLLRAAGPHRSRALLQQEGATLETATGMISAGFYHTCALATNGSAFCWGDNYSGQLGDGTIVGKSSPTPVKSDMVWTQIAVGWNHTCALATNGSVFCWGNNAEGELGDGTTKGRSTPTLVVGGMVWKQISDSFTSLTCALAINGSAFCWGDNAYGQLGDGTQIDKSTPTQIGGSTAWKHISVGSEHTCALATNSSAFCWGANSFGQLGDGTTVPDSGTAGEGSNGTIVGKSTPTRVKGGIAWAEIHAGGYHTCALATNGSAFCWGENSYGNLGDGGNVAMSSPIPVKGGTAWTQMDLGGGHNCVLASNGSAFCWGWNSDGQLGDGTFVNKNEPTPVKGGTAMAYIGTGAWHTCAVSINGSVFCWGYNEYGQLGDGTMPDAKATPAQVKSGAFVASAPPSPGLSPSPSVPPPPGLPPSSPPEQSPAPAPGAAVSPAAIAGGVAAGVVVCVLIAAAVIVRRRSKQRVRAKTSSTSSPPPPQPEDSLVLSDPVLSWINSHVGDMATIIASGNADSPGRTSSIQSSKQSDPDLEARIHDLEFAWKDDVRIIHTLGSGSFGNVFLAEVRHASVAVKVLLDAKTVASASTTVASQTGTQLHELPKVSMASAAALMDEVAAMAPLHHVNVVHLLGFCTAPPALATEYCSRGSVYDMLQKARRDQETASSLSWGVRLRMAADAAAGMLHLHTRSPKPVIHRDVKTPNLLVTGDWVVKVADMGLSKLVEDVTMRVASATADNGGATNPRWLAPEALRGERSTAASDVFSFGVVMWELLTWRVPWDDANPLAIPFAVERGERLAVPDMAALPGFSDDERRTLASSVASYVALMRRCWAADPLARPTFLDIAAELRAALIDF